MDDLMNNNFKEIESNVKPGNDLTSSENNHKDVLISKLNDRISNVENRNKSILILIDNFHHFFSTNELSKMSISVLNELLLIKKNLEYTKFIPICSMLELIVINVYKF